ncbi:MAG: hypothetical protein CMF62_09340 [Magnetococcales bacterium]|nr:hypothetical protein [Magnetococcales bacterium]
MPLADMTHSTDAQNSDSHNCPELDLVSTMMLTVMDSVSDGIFVLKPASKGEFLITAANRTLAGFMQRGLNGKLLSDVLAPEEYRRIQAVLRMVGRQCQSRCFKTEVTIAGHQHQIRLRLEPQCSNGKSQAYVGIVKVMTKTVKMQQENRDLRNRFAASFEHAPYGVSFLQPCHKPVMVNRALARTLNRPVQSLKEQSFESLIHPDDREMFKQALRKVFTGERTYDGIEIRLLCGDGGFVWVAMSLSLTHYGRDDMRYVIMQTLDITSRKENEAELMRLATQDHLTGANNRLVFDRKLRDAISNAQRYNRKGAVLFVDMDHFKQVNDTFGHKVGDAVLKATVNVVSGILRQTDTFARIGGGEFAAILEETDEAKAEIKAQEGREAIAGLKVPVKDQWLDVRASIGVQVFDGADADLTADDIITEADQAMYRQKFASKERAAV